MHELHGREFGGVRDRAAVGGRDLVTSSDERLTALSTHQRLGKSLQPPGMLIFHAPRRNTKVVVHCPLTHAPLTDRMLRAVDLDPHDVQAMIDQRAPLGMSPQMWNAALREIFDGFERAGLSDGLIIKAGGSSVSGFSSRTTTL